MNTICQEVFCNAGFCFYMDAGHPPEEKWWSYKAVKGFYETH